MKDRILKVAYWLHITDGQGQMDILDLSFMAVIVKLLLAPVFDWSAACVMLPIIASQMHQNQIDSKKNITKI